MSRPSKRKFLNRRHVLLLSVFSMVLVLGLFLHSRGVVNSARNYGNSFDSGKWGKRAEDKQTTRDLVPIPTPSMSTSEDGIAPIVNINYPLDGSTHSTYNILIRASSSDNIGISHVLFYVNGVLKFVDLKAEDVYDSTISPNNVPEPEYSYSWTPPTGGATYLIETHAYDFAGNVATDRVQVSTY